MEESSDPKEAPVSVKKKVKPALKQHPVHVTGGPISAPDSASKPKKGLKWDEKAIEEHDQLRGSRMKIEEPNTPYNYYDSDGQESEGSARRAHSPALEDQQLNWDHLNNKLTSVAAVREAYPSSPSSPGGTDPESDREEERRRKLHKLEFEQHRKQHYNEFELLRKFRLEHPDDDDEEDEKEKDDAGDDGDDEMDTA